MKGTTIPPAKRKPAGTVTANYLANGSGKFTLSSLKGKVVVLNYWGSWCPPCTAETPVFDRIYRTVKPEGVAFVGIDTKDTASAAKAFITYNDISYPMLDDQTSKTALQLGNLPMAGLPNTILIDRRGRVAAVYVGAVQAGDLTPVLALLTAEK